MVRKVDNPTVIHRQQMDKNGIRNVGQVQDTFMHNSLITHSEREERSDLLAVIHRDGGHYEAKHGLLKAIEEAERIIVNERITL